MTSFSIDDTATTAFAETPPMSTYLVAFVVSDLKSITNAPAEFTHRVFVQPKYIDAAEYALVHGDVLLNLMQDYLRVNYSLPKMDQVGVSENHFAGER